MSSAGARRTAELTVDRCINRLAHICTLGKLAVAVGKTTSNLPATLVGLAIPNHVSLELIKFNNYSMQA